MIGSYIQNDMDFVFYWDMHWALFASVQVYRRMLIGRCPMLLCTTLSGSGNVIYVHASDFRPQTL